MSYGKFFSSCFTGSMLGAGEGVFALWGYVIAHAVSGQVEINPRLVAMTIGMSLENLTKSLDFLCAPDPESRNKEEDGRRLVKEGQFAYRVVSHNIYRGMRDDDDRREYNRIKKVESRAREKVGLTKRKYVKSSAKSEMSAQAEAEAEAEADTESHAHAVRRSSRAHEGEDDLIGEAPPETGTPVGVGALAPADLSAPLRQIWTDIAVDHGPEVATRARDATKRLFGAATPARMRETFSAAYERSALHLPADQWPDFRQGMRADRAGLQGAPTGTIDPERAAARKAFEERRAKENNHVAR